jgi:hypothetical protein
LFFIAGISFADAQTKLCKVRGEFVQTGELPMKPISSELCKEAVASIPDCAVSAGVLYTG